MTLQKLNDGISDIVRADLGRFTRRAFVTLNPRQHLDAGWYIDAMTHALEKVARGETRRQIITVPPRHLKSICTSVSLCAWMLGHNPALKFLVASYGADLAIKHARDFRLVVEADWFRHAFPDFGRPVRNAEVELVTAGAGGRKAVSLGGSLTGFGADIIIVDDLMKAADASSAVERQRVRDFYEQTLVSRLNDKCDGRIVVIQQRLHEDDLVGFLIEKGGFEHLNLPAIAEVDETIPLPRGRTHLRRVGDVLSARENRDTLDRLRAELGPATFAAQYQQNPTAPGGNVVRWDRFQFYDDTPTRVQCSFIVQSWDTGISISATSDYSVCTTWGYHAGAWKLLDLSRRRLEYPDLLAWVRLQRDHWKSDVVLIEEAASGHQLLQELRNELRALPTVRLRVGESSGWSVRSYRPRVDKLTRMSTEAVKLEDGRALLPRDAPWLPDLRRELLAFPNGRHDDQVDSISQFLDEMPYFHTSRMRERPRIGQR